MTDRVTFRYVRIAKFRGFQDAQRIDVDASAVILFGANGTGKTSFFDALQWLLLGDVARLRDQRTRKNEEYLVNEYARPDDATVEAALVVNGHEVLLRREGRSDGSALTCVVDGDRTLSGADASRELQGVFGLPPDLTFASALLTCGLLQQDALPSLIGIKPEERYQLLEQLLGLGDIERFADHARRRAKQATDVERSSRDEYVQTREELTRLEGRIAALEIRASGRLPLRIASSRVEQDVVAAADLLTIALPPTQTLVGREFAAETRWFRSRLDELARELTRLEAAISDLPRIEPSMVSAATQDLLAARDRLAAAERQRQAAAEALGAVERQMSGLAQLAAAALPLLGDACPVCGQQIVRDSVAQRLQHIAEDTGAVVSARRAVDEATATARSMTTEVDAAQARAVQLREQQERYAAMAQTADRLRTDLANLTSPRGWLRAKSAPTGSPQSSAWFAQADAALVRLQDAADQLAVTETADVDLEERQRVEAQVSALTQELSRREKRIQDASQAATQAKRLADAATDAQVRVVERRLDALRPFISDIYRRLSPHPTFDAFELEHDLYYRRGRTLPVARDTFAAKTVNPATAFSSSQIAVSALAYFLALGWASGREGLPFMLLDDPLQSLDDINALGFADLCRFIRVERQIILSTHDERFAALLERKLTPRVEGQALRVIVFQGWSRGGPVIESRLHEATDLSGARFLETA